MTLFSLTRTHSLPWFCLRLLLRFAETNVSFAIPDHSEDDDNAGRGRTRMNSDAWAFGEAVDDMEEIADHYSFVIESEAYEVG